MKPFREIFRTIIRESKSPHEEKYWSSVMGFEHEMAKKEPSKRALQSHIQDAKGHAQRHFYETGKKIVHRDSPVSFDWVARSKQDA